MLLPIISVINHYFSNYWTANIAPNTLLPTINPAPHIHFLLLHSRRELINLQLPQFEYFHSFSVYGVTINRVGHYQIIRETTGLANQISSSLIYKSVEERGEGLDRLVHKLIHHPTFN